MKRKLENNTIEQRSKRERAPSLQEQDDDARLRGKPEATTSSEQQVTGRRCRADSTTSLNEHKRPARVELEDDDGKSKNEDERPLDDLETPDITDQGDSLPTSMTESSAYHGVYYRQAYRMTPDHFWCLYDILAPHMKDARNKAFRISAALRYFAGGDSAADHHIEADQLQDYVWETVEAIHKCDDFNIEFPSTELSRREIATAFELIKSDVGFDSCVGSLGSMLVWVEKPSSDQAEDYFNQEKEKYGLNMQGVCDHSGRFLFVSVDSPGSMSDYAAFAKSSMCKLMEEERVMEEGLGLYGSEAYSPSPYVVTPFDKVDGESKLRAEFNRSQRQLGGVIEEAFSGLLQRWAVLRRAMPDRYGLDQQKSLVLALCKLQNFCLDDTEPMLLGLARDIVYSLDQGAIFLDPLGKRCELARCGTHFADMDDKEKKQHQYTLKMRNRMLRRVEANR